MAELRGVYGILGFDLNEANHRLALEYDATRLKPEEVGAPLRAAGIPALLAPWQGAEKQQTVNRRGTETQSKG